MVAHSAIITNSLWTSSRGPILFPLFRCCANDFTSTTDDCLFLPWLKSKAGTEISTALSIGMSSYGRALYASRKVKRGDCLLEVPFNVHLSLENLRPDLSELINDDVGSVARVALVILYEKMMGQHSEWEPYITRLPLPGDMHSLIFWTDEEMEMIRPSFLYQETIKQKKVIERDFLGVQLVFDEFPHHPTLEEFTYAYQLVQSRAWGSSKGASLIPFLDFMNHDNTSGAHLFGDEQKQHLVVTADRDYAKGDEVLIRYGKFSNAALLLRFGFTLSNNNWDFFQVDLNIPEDDELYSQKSNMLHDLHTPGMKDSNDFTSSWNSFNIKQGEPIPLSLCAFARILVCNSQQELDGLREEAAQSDGWVARYPLKNKESEIAVHKLLYSKVSQLIMKHYGHFKTLEPTTPDLSDNCVVRRRLAKDLLQGEVRVMETFREWLEITVGRLVLCNT